MLLRRRKQNELEMQQDRHDDVSCTSCFGNNNHCECNRGCPGPTSDLTRRGSPGVPAGSGPRTAGRTWNSGIYRSNWGYRAYRCYWTYRCYRTCRRAGSYWFNWSNRGYWTCRRAGSYWFNRRYRGYWSYGGYRTCWNSDTGNCRGGCQQSGRHCRRF